jgi:hypothetical protein
MSTSLTTSTETGRRNLLNISAYIARERAILEVYNVHENLANLLTISRGLKGFAQLFYFVRVRFIRHNFLIGAKCPWDEDYWRGIVGNLREELGGAGGVSHNELYRRFLYSVGAAAESDLKEPDFAREFNKSWESYIRYHDVEEALFAIAIYEILDGPDYAMLLKSLEASGEGRLDLAFFKVHAAAEHMCLFVDFLRKIDSDRRREKWEKDAAEFVFSTQEQMWKGLIRELRLLVHYPSQPE